MAPYESGSERVGETTRRRARVELVAQTWCVGLRLFHPHRLEPQDLVTLKYNRGYRQMIAEILYSRPGFNSWPFVRSSHTCWTSRGKPTAARVMSLVQPAQQMYL
jgi:hypothetical protein